MEIPIAPERMAKLDAAVRADPGSPDFPLLAETLRRTGELAEAERVARRGLEYRPDCAEGRMVLALVLLDLGRAESARELLADCTGGILARAPRGGAEEGGEDAVVGLDGPVSEGELDEAFAHAELDRDGLIDADDVAHAAMRAADLDGLEVPEDAAADPIFATATMADVLERQGDRAGAARIRAALPPQQAERWPSQRNDVVIAKLEGWLSNLRRIQR